MVRVGGGT